MVWPVVESFGRPWLVSLGDIVKYDQIDFASIFDRISINSVNCFILCNKHIRDKYVLFIINANIYLCSSVFPEELEINVANFQIYSMFSLQLLIPKTCDIFFT